MASLAMRLIWKTVAWFMIVVATIPFVTAYRYDAAYTEYNLNQNQYALDPLEYSGQWYSSLANYTPSPDNWRVPFYTLFLDRFVNGDPYNDNINGTAFEHDLDSNQMRHGGDLQGLIDTLDYLQGMGIKALYIAGSPFLNQPWGYDQYSPIDLTILDPHSGTLETWRRAIMEIHARDMHIVLDNTLATMGDLIGFDGYLNGSAPFTTEEYEVVWRSDRRYLDFSFGNTYNETCEYPRFWNETGFPVDQSVRDSLVGCYDSDFDQYGDTEAFGVYPDWRRQITKFASVQDRLREWHPPVRAKLENFYCMVIAQLDIDGFRYDKATQSTPDAMAALSASLRSCARKYGKNNFYITGEITGGNTFASIYLGRGRQPDQRPEDLTQAITMSHNSSNDQYFLRDAGLSALDSGAFHYTVYRTLTRFLGMDGNLEAGYDAPHGWTDMWNTFILTNDMINAETGLFDPRHMMGVTNQDVFRWPSIRQGINRQLLGHFITTILMPGIPKLLWGEEQAYYILDSTNANYIFGRQPMSAATAWQVHGCYSLGSTQYYNMPFEAVTNGCNDDTVSNDHRDPSAPVRNILRRMYHLRDAYPVLQDGFFLQQLSNQTEEVVYPGSSGVITETGVWSVMRSQFAGVQDLSNATQRDANNRTSSKPTDLPIWLLYSNVNETRPFQFDCGDRATDMNSTALIAPYPSGTTVKNLFHPYDEKTLTDSAQTLGIDGSTEVNGCLDTLEMPPFDFRAYVPIEYWVGPNPVITKFQAGDVPGAGHDARILSKTTPGGIEEVKIELQFSLEMDCDSVTSGISFESKTEGSAIPAVLENSINCAAVQDAEESNLVGGIPSAWSWSATLANVANGVHRVTLDNVTTGAGNQTTNARDHLLFRIGQANNPIVFPLSANYSTTLLSRNDGEQLMLNHTAAGADLYRFSTNFGSSFSEWTAYTGGLHEIEEQTWTGTKEQGWKGDHIRVEYFSRFGGSSAHVQQADIGSAQRRFPNMFLNGPYNSYGFDAGLDNRLKLRADNEWTLHWMTEWTPNGSVAQINVWGINPDGQPDQTMVLGDIDGDSVLDRLPPSALLPVVLNITQPPPKPYLSWRFVVNDGNLRFRLEPEGSMVLQLALYVLLWVLPLITAAISTWIFMMSFYRIKFNKIGVSEKIDLLPLAIRRPFQRDGGIISLFKKKPEDQFLQMETAPAAGGGADQRTVLIATMEYDIEDWKIKIKIGGLGVMSQLMGKNLPNLIWVVPCVGGIDYPVDEIAEPMLVTILGFTYKVNVQYHTLKNITYVLLDAPIFRKQTSAEPYPARMDDMDSAIYYSAWNQCIAQAIQRFPWVDIYHINDYHGTIAPLYLLPRTIPVCLSLHNAEFQGLWPMRTVQECEEICLVFNLPMHTASQYVQFGQVFNLLHAGASYLRLHQEGFGAVGVSKKYGARSYARYPILWGLKEVQALQNPDPSDTGELATIASGPSSQEVDIDERFETDRLDLRTKAQEWAGLEINPKAELFVFVGRWSMQKGVDLIADSFPSILEANPDVQLIAVGPVIDLYGKFTALKLDALMKQYPTRVFSKPEFTALPPFIFTGAEFALIPSRDEPFGLVAVEFGRKGALGVGARVGGLGQMPGWWYTVESTATTHLLSQFKGAIREALGSSTETRAKMRAVSAKQRFPVIQWVEELATLHSTSIRKHAQARTKKMLSNFPPPGALNGAAVMGNSPRPTPGPSPRHSFDLTRDNHTIDKLHLESGSQRTSGPSQAVADPSALRHFARPSEIDSDAIRLIRNDEEGGQPLSSPRVFAEPATTTLQSTVLEVSALAKNGESRSRQHLELSIDTVIGTNSAAFGLQNVDPFFTDSNGTFYKAFQRKLENLSGKNSENINCIETFLMKSEKEWATNIRNAKLGRCKSEMSLSTFAHPFSSHSRASSVFAPSSHTERQSSSDTSNEKKGHVLIDEYQLGADYKPPRGLRNYMQIRIGSWPLYSFLLALGQVISANSYQITLLTGEVGQSANKLYAVASIYLVTSVLWWTMYRRLPSLYSLSLPFLFYGFAFLFIGVAHYAPSPSATGWIQNVGTGFYTIASASGALFFALNFGDDAGGRIESWVFRACIIQGTQQIWVVALWYWGNLLTRQSALGHNTSVSGVVGTWRMTAIALPIAVALWAMGLALWLGLPAYYRQAPGTTAAFYTSVLKRKVVVWFAVTVVVQNFFMSAPYGRNWSFLFSSHHAKEWQILLMAAGFFIGVWALLLWILAHLSKAHTWILPIVAIGLGAPRFGQILWGTSNIGLWLPWAGGYVSSALASRAVWLWLGVLDSIQGVGIGMILLATLTRAHVAFTITMCQVLGSITTILARGVAPNKIGPGPISPDLSQGIGALGSAWFWVALVAQLIICLGFFKVYRKEQLQKP